MSRFFDETQRAQQRAPQVAEGGRVDVVSVIDAIKQSDTLALEPPEVADVSAGDRQEIERARTETEAEKPVRGPIKITKDDNPLRAQAMEAYGSLRTRVMKLKASKGFRSLMLTSSVPAEGKTWTSLNLAISCAKLHGFRVLLVDGDLRSRGLTRLLGIPDGPGLSDFLGGKATAEKSILPTENDNLFVLGAGSLNGQPSDLFASPLWAEFMGGATRSYGMVIVDAPPVQGLSDAELISAGCDGILVVVRASSTLREIAQKSVNRLDKKKLIGIVFNGQQSGLDRDSYYGYASGISEVQGKDNGSR
jgi:capsular exopolysaccharide synthesis family protein